MIRRCVLSVSAAFAITGLLAACSSSGDDTRTPSSPSPRKSSAASAEPITQPSSVPTSVPNNPATRKNARLTSCSAVTGGWEARGTVENTGTARKTFTITVFFTTDPGATVQSYGATKLGVARGSTGTWSVTRKFAATRNTTCVLRGVG